MSSSAPTTPRDEGPATPLPALTIPGGRTPRNGSRSSQSSRSTSPTSVLRSQANRSPTQERQGRFAAPQRTQSTPHLPLAIDGYGVTQASIDASLGGGGAPSMPFSMGYFTARGDESSLPTDSLSAPRSFPRYPAFSLGGYTPTLTPDGTIALSPVLMPFLPQREGEGASTPGGLSTPGGFSRRDRVPSLHDLGLALGAVNDERARQGVRSEGGGGIRSDGEMSEAEAPPPYEPARAPAATPSADRNSDDEGATLLPRLHRTAPPSRSGSAASNRRPLSLAMTAAEDLWCPPSLTSSHDVSPAQEQMRYFAPSAAETRHRVGLDIRRGASAPGSRERVTAEMRRRRGAATTVQSGEDTDVDWRRDATSGGEDMAVTSGGEDLGILSGSGAAVDLSTSRGTTTPDDTDSPSLPLRLLLHTLRLLAAVPGTVGTFWLLRNALLLLVSRGGVWRDVQRHGPGPGALEFAMASLWSVSTAYHALSFTTLLLRRWLVYYSLLPSIIRLIALQAICWPLVRLTLFVAGPSQPLLAWLVIATTTALSDTVARWVTSNIADAPDDVPSTARERISKRGAGHHGRRFWRAIMGAPPSYAANYATQSGFGYNGGFLAHVGAGRFGRVGAGEESDADATALSSRGRRRPGAATRGRRRVPTAGQDGPRRVFHWDVALRRNILPVAVLGYASLVVLLLDGVVGGK